MDDQAIAARPSGPFATGPIERDPGPIEAGERDPRYDNQPPLEDRILMDFVDDIEREGIATRISELLASTERAPTECSDAEVAGKIGDLCKQARAVGKKLDDARERHNRQLIDARTSLKARADNLIAPLNAAIDKIRAGLDEWTAKEAERRAEEQRANARIAYAKQVLQHIEDCGNGFIGGQPYAFPILIRELEEKIGRGEHEFGALADEVERARVAALDKVKAALERQIAAAPKAEEAAPPQAEAAPEPPPAPTFETPSRPAPAPVARGMLGSAVGATTVWNFEIENMRLVPDRYLKHPKVKEALESVIRTAIRTEKAREIKGVRIWPGTKAAIR